MDISTFLYNLPPAIMETFCKIIDSGDDSLGWRGLAARIVPSWLDVRRIERLEVTGKSPTRELIWSWAQQNTTVADLQRVLEEMGHLRALQLFQPDPKYSSYNNGQLEKEPPSPPMPMPFTPDIKYMQSERIPAVHVPVEGTKHRHVITYSDVLEGTRHFHQDMKIAEGHFSEVYRAVKGNETLAVKLFTQVQKASWRKLWELFRIEMEVHHLYQHPNILELLGCFSEGDRYCLVYPYLPNGSLSHRLHDQSAEDSLSWQKRLDIIKGTAKAVYYLHMAQPCTVVCGNITSANILLDQALQPKLCDFGTARLRPHSVNQSCTIALATGSHRNLGYLPEEYMRDGKLSTGLDVYSFGMVIMETITGRKVIEDSPKQTLLRDILSGAVEESGNVDSCLRYLDRRAGPWPHATALCLFRLALDCTCSRRSRPDMEAVLQELSQLLPLPCPPEDQPRTLDERASGQAGHGPCPSMPMEDDEQHSYPVASPQSAPGRTPGPRPQPGPCEGSQSEMTYLSSGEECVSRTPRPLSQEEAAVHNPQTEAGCVDLYGSWPVQCSCSAEVDGQSCEDCKANGFTSCPSDLPQGETSYPFQNIVQNLAKETLRNKIELYNEGLIQTEELLSLTHQ